MLIISHLHISGEMSLYKASFGDDENVLKLYYGHSSITLKMHSEPLNCTLKCVNFMAFKLFLIKAIF